MTPVNSGGPSHQYDDVSQGIDISTAMCTHPTFVTVHVLSFLSLRRHDLTHATI